MNDPWLDEQIREAYSQVSLPEDRVRRILGPPARSRLPGVWIALAAAAAAAIVSWPLLTSDHEVEPTPLARHPTTAPPEAAPASTVATEHPSLTGLWIGTTGEARSFKVTVLSQDPSGELDGTIEIQQPLLFQSLAFTGQVRGTEVVLTTSELSVVLTVSERRMSGWVRIPGKPDLAVMLSGPPARNREPPEPTGPRPATVQRPFAEEARKPPSADVERGWALVDSDPRGALALFAQAVAQDPSNAHAHYGHGYAQLQLSRGTDQAEATASLCLAMALSPRELTNEISGLLGKERLSCTPSAQSPPQATLPTLEIRSNRRVLVYVDSRAIGYTPQDVEVSVGKHQVSVKLPGQPSSLQVREVDVTGTMKVEFTL